MDITPFMRNCRSAIIQSRVSPISCTAMVLTFCLAAIGVTASIDTRFMLASLPDILPLLGIIVGLDFVSQLAPPSRITENVQIFVYGIMYLVITSVCGVLAVYATQRFAFPLQDHFLASADAAFGLNWFDFAHWVDRHAALQSVFYWSYNTLSLQIAVPLGVLAFMNRPSEVRTYLLAFVLAFIMMTVVSIFVPAIGPIVYADPATFHLLHFTGATPVEQLMRLRQPGPLILNQGLGGIVTFPSFHATVAVLVPLTLRKYPRIFIALLILNVAMLGATATEGAHYFSDIIAGGYLAFLAYAMARRIVATEDRLFNRVRDLGGLSYSTAHMPA